MIMATEPKALLFDVFGTLVDWRTSIARESEQVLRPLGVVVDWLAFADAWRGEYQGAMDQVRDGHIPFCKLDVLHRRNLDRILPRFNVSGISENALRYLNLAYQPEPFRGGWDALLDDWRLAAEDRGGDLFDSGGLIAGENANSAAKST